MPETETRALGLPVGLLALRGEGWRASSFGRRIVIARLRLMRCWVLARFASRIKRDDFRPMSCALAVVVPCLTRVALLLVGFGVSCSVMREFVLKDLIR